MGLVKDLFLTQRHGRTTSFILLHWMYGMTWRQLYYTTLLSCYPVTKMSGCWKRIIMLHLLFTMRTMRSMRIKRCISNSFSSSCDLASLILDVVENQDGRAHPGWMDDLLSISTLYIWSEGIYSSVYASMPCGSKVAKFFLPLVMWDSCETRL